jgi:hypothetical protein
LVLAVVINDFGIERSGLRFCSDKNYKTKNIF